jgi:DNA-binding transcriptional MerR regulator
VEQLAGATGVSVDTIRFYQSRGLLPPPRRQGRVGWYDDDHRERLERIRGLQSRGLTLATIRRLLTGELDAADEALAAAVSDKQATTEVFGLDELAERSGIPTALLQAALQEGLLAPEWGGFTDDDVAAAKAGLTLLEEGVPLSDLLALARAYHEATRQAAERAVELFDQHVRHPLRSSGLPDDLAATRLVAAFQRMLPATTTLVTHHFTRTLLAVAMEHIERVGDEAELQAVKEASG